jgi:hypothetical protein
MRLVLKQYNKRKDVNKNVNAWMKQDKWGWISYHHGGWWYISFFQKLSERFIGKYKDRVIWYWISYHQKLSESFIEKYKDKVDWYLIFKSQNLSPEFREKWKHKCG